jgi:hypothetical protein
MKLDGFPFQAIDWTTVPPVEHPGDPGVATWRTVHAGAVRIRMVDYSAGYVADHWCDKGHVILVVDGELMTELRDGRTVTLRSGDTYVVADNDAGAAHRSRSPRGARLFIVD